MCSNCSIWLRPSTGYICCIILYVFRHHENETVWIRTAKITRTTSVRNSSCERNDIHKWGTWELRSKHLWGNLKVRDNFKNLGMWNRIILKYICREGLVRFWTELTVWDLKFRRTRPWWWRQLVPQKRRYNLPDYTVSHPRRQQPACIQLPQDKYSGVQSITRAF